jgi:hypothetical protein
MPPNYGLKVLAKGYHTVRKTIMKGNEIYVVSDLDGKPLFSITEGCDIDFRPIIIRAADKIISLGINRPVLVFDRGGYGVHFFSQLSTRANFVTWAKYVKKDELKDLEYTSCLMFFVFLQFPKGLSRSRITARFKLRKNVIYYDV